MKFYILLLVLFISTLSFTQETLSVEKIWKNYEFQQRGVAGFNSLRDGEYYTELKSEDGILKVMKFAFNNEKFEEELFSNKEMMWNNSRLIFDAYEFNKDESKVLLMTNVSSIYRRSFTANYFIYDLKSKKIVPLDEKRELQTLAEFSPDGKFVAYVSDNNIYVKDLQNGQNIQLTNDGEKNKIINGTTDWVYEEEFGITKGFEWSFDSQYIAFLKFDESQVKEFQMTYYGDLYPEQYKFKYPKAGEDNSRVSLYLAQVQEKKIFPIDLPEFEYLPRLKWSPIENKLIFQTLNRYQNNLKVYALNANDFKLDMFFEESSKQYVDIDDNLIILNDGKSMLRTSETTGFNHIQRLFFDGKTEWITSGDFDVISFYGVDYANKYVYYAAAKTSAVSKSIFKTDLKKKKSILLSEEIGYSSADFSAGMSCFLKSYSDANTPRVYSLCDNNGKTIRILEDNKSLVEKMKKYNLSKKEFFQIKGYEEYLNATIIKPKNFDERKKYPVYINIYGGPGSNMVTDDFDGNDYFYHQLLVQSGYIVVSVDPRGTMFRGAKFKKSTYLQLGKLETEDFIAVAQELSKLTYVDPTRIGIQGWSYGGYMTSLAMTKGADYFKMGIAVAPVTNWKYYDNIYTERFMRTPQENTSGYEENSPINHVDKLKGNYLLIHGSADDNVHYQNTMEMINALVKNNKQFDLFIYPNKNHGIYGGNTRNHLFNMMYNYTLKNL